MHKKWFILILLGSLHSTNTFATDLFNSISQSPAFPQPGVTEIYNVELNFDALKSGPQTLSVEIGDDIDLVFQLKTFEAIAGYTEDLSSPAPGCNASDNGECPLIPIPGLVPEGFRFNWVGTNYNVDVTGSGGFESKLMLSWVNGALSGYLTSSSGHFVIGRYEVAKVDMSYHLSGLENDTPSVAQPKATYETYKGVQIPDCPPPQSSNPTPDTSFGNEVDILVLYTESARVQEGGNSAVCTDTTHIDAIIEQAKISTQLTFSYGTDTKVNFLRPYRLTGMPTFSSGFTMLSTMSNNNNIKALRDEVGADVVVTLIADADVSSFNSGFALVIPDDVNTDFSPSYYSWVKANSQRQLPKIFAHEVGHLAGLHHAQENDPISPPLAYTTEAFGYDRSSRF